MKDITNDPFYVEPDEDGDVSIAPGAPVWTVRCQGEVITVKNANWFNQAKHLGLDYEVLEFTKYRPPSS